MFNLYQRAEKLSQPFPEDYKQTPPSSLLAFVYFYCKGFRFALFIILLCSIVLAVAEVYLIDFIGNIMNFLSDKSPESLWREEKYTLIMMSVLALLVIPLCNALNTITRHQLIMGNMPMAVRWRMHNYLLGQSLQFYQNEFSGRISAKVMQTALSVRAVANTTMDVLAYAGAYFFSVVVVMMSLHWLMLLLILLWLFVYCLMLYYFLPRMKHISEAQSHARSTMTGRITDAYTNITTVKLFAHTAREAHYARSAMGSFLKTVYQQMRYAASLDALLTALNYVLLFMVVALGVLLWSKGAFQLGGIAVASAFALRLNGMSHWIMYEIAGLFENIGTVADGMHMMQQPIAIQDKKDCTELKVAQGEIEFKGVSFTYNGAQDKSVLKDLNLKIKAGEKIGLVGRSGAGKSTLVNTLLRFYDLNSGEILIDGQNIADVSQESLRRHIAMVTQDTALLHRSVRENILYGKPEASEEELARAIHLAAADDFIKELSDPMGNHGLDAQVGERGVKLSGGQRQRIAIARVLLKNAPILILDEATSALDSEVEAAIQESLNCLMQGKTVIAIAHRLSTIAEMDRLIVLDKGEIAEMGSHEELLRKNGIYAQLWHRQTGGYIGE